MIPIDQLARVRRPPAERNISPDEGVAGFHAHPATADRWADLEQLFGERGACGGCWCMWYRLPRREYEARRGEANRRALKALAFGERAPGVIGYQGEMPVAWCSVAPRAEYRRLLQSRTMRPIDDVPAWLIMCLFVSPAQRRSGLSVRMIEAACRYAHAQGASAVDAYPILPKTDDVPAIFASQGTLSAYLDAGFKQIARPASGRALVRWQPPSG